MDFDDLIIQWVPTFKRSSADQNRSVRSQGRYRQSLVDILSVQPEAKGRPTHNQAVGQRRDLSWKTTTTWR